MKETETELRIALYELETVEKENAKLRIQLADANICKWWQDALGREVVLKEELAEANERADRAELDLAAEVVRVRVLVERLELAEQPCQELREARLHVRTAKARIRELEALILTT